MCYRAEEPDRVMQIWKEASRKDHSCMTRLYKAPRMCTSLDKGSRFVVLGAWKDGVLSSDGWKVQMSFVGDENILEGVLVNVHICECTENHSAMRVKQRTCYTNYTSIKLFKTSMKTSLLRNKNTSKRIPTSISARTYKIQMRKQVEKRE